MRNKKSRPMNRVELHKAYMLGIAIGFTVIAGIWNYSSTADYNALQESRAHAINLEIAIAAGPELLKPPILNKMGN